MLDSGLENFIPAAQVISDGGLYLGRV